MSTRKPNSVLYMTPSLSADTGGPARSITGLATAISYRDFKITVATLNIKSFSGTWIVPDQQYVETVELAIISKRLTGQLWQIKLLNKLQQLISDRSIQLLHDNGVWQPINLYAAIAAKQANIPLVVSTRGMLEPWSLEQKRLAKKAIWFLYQRQILTHAHVLHATSANEAENLRRLRLKQPIAVVPNAVDIPRQEPCKYYERHKKSHTLLFMSRIHPKKGILTLVEAAKRVDLTNWMIIIAGPNENNHASEVKLAVKAAGLEDTFLFPGEINDKEKWALYQQADLFVLPSYSENFGIVVAEALAVGVPVITTKGCPWQDLEAYQCGWWIDVGIEPLVDALRQAISLSDAERRQMGQNGTRLIMEKYGWPSVADQMASVYRWMLKQGPQPSCII